MPSVRPFALLIVIIGASCLLIYAQLKNSEELQAKPEWSMLQNLEFRYRADQSDRPVIIEKRHDYCAAGMLSADKQSRVWLLLNAKDAPLVKKLSDINYELSEDEFGRILRFCAVSNEVQLELREHLKP